jgi:NTP pyrophosphatase (non-canonical NTP hydrolase)
MRFIESYKKFLDLWGYEAQSRMCIEEMSELTKELCKVERFKNDQEKKEKIIENIKEEIADVLNTVEQMAYYYGIESIEKIREEKIEKVMKRLN